MDADNFLLRNDTCRKLCQAMCRVLNCNLLWVMKLDNYSLKILLTDTPLLKHYWDKKYYLQDPSLHLPQQEFPVSNWKVTLGTECDIFNKSGFLYDLYKMFNIEEFASIEKRIDSEWYCFRFFTRNNRFVFMNRLISNMPIIKHFTDIATEKFKAELHNQPAISITELI